MKKPQKKQTKAGRGGKSKAEKKAPRAARADSKQAQLIAMLKRAKGASIDEIVEAFDWQPHTVRGAIAGALEEEAWSRCHLRKDGGSRARLSHRSLTIPSRRN